MMGKTLLQGLIKAISLILEVDRQDEISVTEGSKESEEIKTILARTVIENPWFTATSVRQALEDWRALLEEEAVEAEDRPMVEKPRKVGIILDGVYPLAGFNDILAVILQGDRPVIKLAEKDKRLIPLLLRLGKTACGNSFGYELTERMPAVDLLIATTEDSRKDLFNQYFKSLPHLVRVRKTSVAVLDGKETKLDLKGLSEDVFHFMGFHEGNVRMIFIPENYSLDQLFEAFYPFGYLINHNRYANNYEYNRAIFLLNNVSFLDNNFVLLREAEEVKGLPAVIHYRRYKDKAEVEDFLNEHKDELQYVASNTAFSGFAMRTFGKTPKPFLQDPEVAALLKR